MTDTTEALPPLPEPVNAGSTGFGQLWRPLFTADQMRDYVRADRAQRQQVPEGWQLVPKVPTGAMWEAGVKCILGTAGPTSKAVNAYRAMLAAAPALTAAPSAQAEPQVPPDFFEVWKVLVRYGVPVQGREEVQELWEHGIGKQESK